jgi:hypothetical protein
MRLPTRTPRQAQYEDARQFHERLWEAHQAGRPITMFTSARLLSWSVSDFWRRRGFRLRCATLPSGVVRVSLESR